MAEYYLPATLKACSKIQLLTPIPSAFRGTGEGFLAGTYPLGITSVAGVPSSAEVLVAVSAPGTPSDGAVIARTTSDTAGVWSLDGLDPARSYNVLGRKAGYNDVIQSAVRPYAPVRVLSRRYEFFVGEAADFAIPVRYGVPAYTVALNAGTLPSGVTLSAGHLTASFPTGSAGTYPITLAVSDQRTPSPIFVNADVLLLLRTLLIGVVLPSSVSLGDTVSGTTTASGGEAPYTYSYTGTLPTGLSLNTVTGDITGTVSAGGAFSFTVVATDARSTAASSARTMNVVTPRAYWRINITSTNNHCSVAELEFAGSAGGANLCTGGTAISDSFYPAGGGYTYVAANAFDGTVTTGPTNSWAAASSASGWIGYHFATPVAIAEARICRRPEGSQSPNTFDIQYSDDGVTWVTTTSYSGVTSWVNSVFIAFAA